MYLLHYLCDINNSGVYGCCIQSLKRDQSNKLIKRSYDVTRSRDVTVNLKKTANYLNMRSVVSAYEQDLGKTE